MVAHLTVDYVAVGRAYCCDEGFSTPNTAPCGSDKTAEHPTVGISNGAAIT
ncbi:hypothetical protein BZL30_8703 [Mycobacterium kansasii]|uniref:Uncharacterized protein n=2 Tax=Mycobacterium kansasii TaxID=1768 RepID=A0A1V3WF02_MYCKA|nr:hypothetical protein MKAN_18980 [Mycobacterium kansasii ATCC 12478]OOK65564.1 hypothetical protein BZL30_8703 [Mycobacterium kansasii]